MNEAQEKRTTPLGLLVYTWTALAVFLFMFLCVAAAVVASIASGFGFMRIANGDALWVGAVGAVILGGVAFSLGICGLDDIQRGRS